MSGVRRLSAVHRTRRISLRFHGPFGSGELQSNEPNAPQKRETAESPPPAATTDRPPPAEAGSGENRSLILHYHMFKNAGTSIDEMLKHNFGSRWGTHEFGGAGARHSNCEAVGQYLREHPDLVAFSSHTALLPTPVIKGIAVFPIVFIRNPLDRLHSAYVFERAQMADTAGARLAKEHDFAGYLRELLKAPRMRQARSFQTFRLAMNSARNEGTDIQRALRALDELPFVGLVEEFEKSVKRLDQLLKPVFPDFQAVVMHKNITRSATASLKERRAQIRKSLGRQFLAEVRAANADDLELYRAVKSRYSGTVHAPVV
jgi:hypothetical protein